MIVLPFEGYLLGAFLLAAFFATFLSYLILRQLVLYFKSGTLNSTSFMPPQAFQEHKEVVVEQGGEIDKLNQLVFELKKTRKELEDQKSLLEEALLLVEKDNYRKTEELLEAQQLQLSMLPQHTPFYPGYEIALYSHPASEVGGDYYDYRFGKHNKVLNLVLGDATGHGLKPAILVATAKSYFQTLSGRCSNREIVKRLSEAILSLNTKGFYMGLSLLEMDGDLLSLVSTGMPPVFFYDLKKEQLAPHLLKGMFLGVRKGKEAQKKVFRMHRGDILLLMTDGLAECQNKEGELLGYEAIAEALEKNVHNSSMEMIHALLSLGKGWSAGRAQQDDISLMVIKRK